MSELSEIKNYISTEGIDTDFQKQIESIITTGGDLELLFEGNEIEKDFLEYLDRNLIGQNEAKKVVAKSILGINKVGQEDGVLSTMFFAGPTGVGKTEIAKLLSQYLTGSRDNFTIIQGAEYQEAHKIANLVGSPKGYAGYGEPPIFSTTKLFKNNISNPHKLIQNKEQFAIILIDEAEKMHPKIIQSLLGVLQDGKVFLSTGKEDKAGEYDYSNVTDMRNTIWIFTSNIGSNEVNEESHRKPMGFANTGKENINFKSIYKNQFENYFSPEFRGRLDYFVVFDNLDEKDIDSIIDMNIDKINRKLEKNGFMNLEIAVTNELKEYIKNVSNISLGARNIGKIISKLIENKISEMNSLNMLSTAVLTGIKLKHKIILEFGLKKNYKDFEFEQDRISAKLKGEKITSVITNTQSVLADTYLQENTPIETITEMLEGHESIHKIFKIINSKFTNLFEKREKSGHKFNEELKKLLPIMNKVYGDLDFLSYKINSYINIVNDFLNQGETKHDESLQKFFGTIKLLGQKLGYDKSQIKAIIKNKLNKNKNKPDISLLSGLSNLDNIGINIDNVPEKVKIIAITLLEIENMYYKDTFKYMGKNRLHSIISYLNEIY